MRFLLLTMLSLAFSAGAETNRLVVTEGLNWIPIDDRRNIVAGSALDFSGFGQLDAPAGRHGWLRNEKGSFVFEDSLSVRRKFYGVNLSQSATVCSHEKADRLTDRLVRLGYNSIRIHHHDGLFATYTNGLLRLHEANVERMDYLIAAAIKRGLYVTTDLYVSRPVSWRQIGCDQDGDVPRALYKSFVGHHAGIRADWQSFARLFLEHVNPYTGRRYADEPGMPLLSLMNEGAVTMYWDEICSQPILRAAWKTWLAGRRAFESSHYKDVPDDPTETRADFWKGKGKKTWHDEVYEFAADLERINYIYERDFVRSLGAKALLTSVNYYARSKDFRALRAELFDYADNHFYVDHPSALDGANTIPMINPAKQLPHELTDSVSARAPGLPFVVTEWNWCPPSRYRNGSGLLTGTVAVLQGWDGLWRFDYASHERTIDSTYHLTNFQMVLDPVSVISDRAMLCLFLRGDMPTATATVTEIPERAQERLRAITACDATNGTFAVSTPRTCGVFAESGVCTAGVLTARVLGCPAAVWASVVDKSPSLSVSDRILVAHVTDAASEGSVFSGERLNTQECQGGSRLLVRVGQAVVRLMLNDATAYEVWSLATDGARREIVPSAVRDGVLAFMADVARDRKSGTFLYEVVRCRPAQR